MWRKKTDKRIVAAGLIVLALIIGYQSWKDFQPHLPESKVFSYTPFILATEAAEMNGLTKEITRVVAWAGDLKATGGETVFTPSTLAPAIVPQRDLTPMFTLDEMPAALPPLFEEIAKAVEPWKDAGNIINNVYIDYQAAKPDFEALEAVVNGLRAHMDKEIYVILQVRRGVTLGDPATRNSMANLLKAVQYFSYDVKDVRKPGETNTELITRLDAESIPFMLRIDTRPPDTKPGQANPEEEPKQFFVGFLLDSDTPKKPLEEKTP